MYPVKFDLGDDIKNEIKTKRTDVKEVPDDWGTGGILVAESENEFMNFLKDIFGSNKARQVITAILAQSGAFD